jgi:hypothetical protein
MVISALGLKLRYLAFGCFIFLFACAPPNTISEPKYITESKYIKEPYRPPAKQEITPLDKLLSPVTAPSSVPDLQLPGFTAYAGTPPKGTLPDEIARMRPHWTTPNFWALGEYNRQDAQTPIHYGRGMVIIDPSNKLFQYYTRMKYQANDYYIPEEWFEHNVANTLWSAKGRWYIKTNSRVELGRLIFYLSKNKISDEQCVVTEADVQTWRLQEL